MRVEIEVGKQLIMSTFTAEKHETREWWNVFLKVFNVYGKRIHNGSRDLGGVQV